jgi:hypothetical protein
MQASKRFRFSLASNPVAALSTERLSSVVDVAGFRGALFLCTLGSGTTAATFKIQQAAATSGAFADISGASQAVVGANDNRAIAIDVVDPRKRYLRSSFATTAGGGTWDFGGVVVGLYDAGALPTSAGSGMLGVVSVVSAT